LAQLLVVVVVLLLLAAGQVATLARLALCLLQTWHLPLQLLHQQQHH
jgi:hypothetical protein